MLSEDQRVPVIDVGGLVARTAGRFSVAESIGAACRDHGFFYIVGHGVDEELQQRLESLSRAFFALPPETKLKIAMEHGGRAWRGYFPPGGELTSGRPDLKEGVYFGSELAATHPLVRAGLPLHGPNLFPEELPGLRQVVLDYLSALTRLGHDLMRGVSLSLGLDEDYFASRYTADPLILFRIFNYPVPQRHTADDRWSGEVWGVGEHTDYGLLTILRQDEVGGLEIRTGDGWIDAPPVSGSFVCNIGDMLERLTAGLYRSTPHRVRNRGERDRLSFPFFFDPNFEASIDSPVVSPPQVARVDDPSRQRWDGANPLEFSGTYGDYLLAKVGKVFPHLSRDVLTHPKLTRNLQLRRDYC